MEANELIAAFDQMVKSGTPIQEATQILNEAVRGITPSEDLILREFQSKNPGLSPDEYRALLDAEFPEDEDQPVLRKAKIQNKAIELAKAQQTAALERMRAFVPTNEEAVRRAELAKSWQPKAAPLVESLNIYEGVALNLDAEAKKAIVSQVAEYAAQQGWEVSDDNAELMEHAQRLALFLSGPKAVEALVKSKIAEGIETYVREIASRPTGGGSPRPVRSNLPQAKPGFV